MIGLLNQEAQRYAHSKHQETIVWNKKIYFLYRYGPAIVGEREDLLVMVGLLMCPWLGTHKDQ